MRFLQNILIRSIDIVDCFLRNATCRCGLNVLDVVPEAFKSVQGALSVNPKALVAKDSIPCSHDCE